MKKTAFISDCGEYRYELTRTWDTGPTIVFIGLNPSTADADIDDPTIRRCIGFAQAWGYGTLVMLNAYAYRSTDPAALSSVLDPIGPLNERFLQSWRVHADMLVACWGAGIEPHRQERLRVTFQGKLHYLRLTKAGFPGHPLYLPKTLTPQPWKSS